jgi:DMSO/TMAO reductase YedYZ molybdopterin-dependent catalytic subunit
MKRKLFYCLWIVLFAFLTACSSSSEATGSNEVVLEVVGFEETEALTMKELKELPATEGWGGIKNSAGKIFPAEEIKGVLLTDLIDLVGGFDENVGVSIVAKDGYSMTMSYDQITEGDFITYDPGTGEENEVDYQMKVIVAYQRDGEPIPADDDGPLRLYIIGEDNNQVVDGHWIVKWVEKIELKPMAEEWSLYLEGAITEEMDRNSYESCVAPGCHQNVWVDEDGNEWAGVPLFKIAGRVDDGVAHEDRAYNDDFAEAGYVVELFAADGYNVSIESERIHFNEDIILASMLNGEPLPEEDYPLRLVGEGLEGKEMVGQVAQIVLDPDEGVEWPSTEEPAAEAEGEEEVTLPEGAVLMIHGQVMNTLTLSMENLEAMNIEEVEIEHPKKGMQTYAGLRLATLLGLAGASPDSSMLVMTASDGYSAEVALSDALNCEDCLVAVNEDGTVDMVMAGMQTNVWVKDVNFLEVE